MSRLVASSGKRRMNGSRSTSMTTTAARIEAALARRVPPPTAAEDAEWQRQADENLQWSSEAYRSPVVEVMVLLDVEVYCP